MARDQRTRLNAELAGQFNSGARKPGVTPGRSSLTGELVETADGAEPELAEEEVQVAEEPQEVVAREPKKSLFELPRKEPSRQPLLSSSSVDTKKPGAPGAAPKPGAPKVGASNNVDKKPSGPRRG